MFQQRVRARTVVGGHRGGNSRLRATGVLAPGTTLGARMTVSALALALRLVARATSTLVLGRFRIILNLHLYLAFLS